MHGVSTYVRACSDARELSSCPGVHLQAHWDDVSTEFWQNTDSHFLAHCTRTAVGHTYVQPCICRLHASKQQGAPEVCMQGHREGTRRFAGPPAPNRMTRGNEHAWLVAKVFKEQIVAY